MTHQKPAFLAFCSAVLLTFVLFATLLVLPDATAQSLKAEGGPIESASALLYFVGFVALAIKGLATVWPYATLMLAFGLREMDMDKIPFTEGLLKSRQYVGDTVALPERLIAAVVLITILTAVVITLKRGTKPMLAGLKAGDWTAFTIALAIFLGFTAKTLDGITRKMAGFSVEVSPYTDKIATYYEETAELGMATALVGLALIWSPKAHTTTPEGA